MNGTFRREPSRMPVSRSPKALDRRAFLGALFAPIAVAGAGWPEFRGDGSNFLVDHGRLPVEWSDRKNVSWSVAPPGYGQSSPVLYGDKAFVTSVDGSNKETLMIAAFDLFTGKSLWTHYASPAQSIAESNTVSKAAPTPVVNADGVYAFFETGNLVAVNHGGQLRWERRLTEEFGEFWGRHGIGSSLRLCQSGVIALAAHDGPSYLICLDCPSGKTVWKTDRPKGVSWSTPTIVEQDGRELALVSSRDRVDAYDTLDGSLLWTLNGLEGTFVASPTPIPGGAIIGSSNKGQTAAIRFGSNARSTPEIVWRASEAASYFNSPLAYRSRVYMVNKAGVAFCLDLETGRMLWHQRLKGPCWASSIGTQDFVYFFGVNGVVSVYRATDSALKVAENRLSEESRLYGIAVSEERLILRFGRRLACIRSRPGGGEEPSKDRASLWNQNHAVEIGNR